MGAVTTGILAGISVLSAAGQANAQGVQADFNSAMADINIRKSKIQEADAIARGSKYASKYRSDVKGVIGSQQVALAGQGVDISSGTAADLQQDTFDRGYEDAQTIENNSFREALGFANQAQDYKINARMGQAAARTNQAGTILTGGLNAARYVNSNLGYGEPNSSKGSGSFKKTPGTTSSIDGNDQ